MYEVCRSVGSIVLVRQCEPSGLPLRARLVGLSRDDEVVI